MAASSAPLSYPSSPPCSRLLMLTALVLLSAAISPAWCAQHKPRTEAVSRPRRALDMLESDDFGGFRKRALDLMDGDGFSGFYKRALDTLEGDDFMGLKRKRALNALEGDGFGGLDKRALDILDGDGFDGLNKRSSGIHRALARLHQMRARRALDALEGNAFGF